jgi:hypothetical protein
MKKISHPFLTYASDILADTQTGLTATEIAKFFVSQSVDYGVDIPYSGAPFSDVPNKRTAFLKNLEVFNPQQQFSIILELCHLDKFQENTSVTDLKSKLLQQYSEFAEKPQIQVDKTLLEDTSHWLANYPNAYKQFTLALGKYNNKVYERNLLDDLRLCLELLLKDVLKNSRRLEKQISDLGEYQKERGISTEVRNMFATLLIHYATYQNENVKHNDRVNPNEVDFILEVTITFIKLIINLKNK